MLTDNLISLLQNSSKYLPDSQLKLSTAIAVKASSCPSALFELSDDVQN